MWQFRWASIALDVANEKAREARRRPSSGGAEPATTRSRRRPERRQPLPARVAAALRRRVQAPALASATPRATPPRGSTTGRRNVRSPRRCAMRDERRVSWGRSHRPVLGRRRRALWHRVFDGGWGDAESLGGPLASGPAVTAWAPDRMEVFAVFPDGALWNRYWDGASWHAWESLGGRSRRRPTPAASSLGRRPARRVRNRCRRPTRGTALDGPAGSSGSQLPAVVRGSSFLPLAGMRRGIRCGRVGNPPRDGRSRRSPSSMPILPPIRQPPPGGRPSRSRPDTRMPPGEPGVARADRADVLGRDGRRRGRRPRGDRDGARD